MGLIEKAGGPIEDAFGAPDDQVSDDDAVGAGEPL